MELLPRFEGRDAALDGDGDGKAGGGEEDGEVGELREVSVWMEGGLECCLEVRGPERGNDEGRFPPAC